MKKKTKCFTLPNHSKVLILGRHVRKVITDNVDGHAGPSCPPSVNSHTGDLPPSAQVQFGRVQLQPGALAVGAVPGLPVARHAAHPQRPGRPVGAFKLPAQLQREGGEAGRLAVDFYGLTRNSEGQRGGVEGEGRRF